MNRLFFGKLSATLWFSIALYTSAFIAMPAMAAQAEATVTKNVVGVNEVFQLTVSIDDSVSNNALDLAPLSPDFAYGRPSVSSNTSMINGVFSRSTRWTVALAATKVGTLTIPAFQIGSATTTPITITVMKSANQTQNATSSSLSIEGITDNNAFYVGETINYRVRIFIGEQMDQASLAAPYGDGLTATQVGQDAQNEVIKNGRRYIVLTRNYHITAHQSGSITLHGAKFSGNAIKGRRGFGSTLTMPVEATAQDLTLSIKAKPDNYQGLWLPTPDLTLDQEWRPDFTGKTEADAKVGEPITRILTLRIKNIAQSNMPDIRLDYPNTVRSYNEKPEYSENNGYTIMTLKQVIIPRETGKISLPEVKIHWWNTQKEQKQSSSVQGITLNVSAEPNAAVPMPSPAAPASPVAQQPLNRPDPVNAPLTAGSTHPYWQWATAIFALLWLITLWRLFSVRKAQTITSTDPITAIASSDINKVLQQAIKQRQTLQIHTYYQQWKHQHPMLAHHPELLQQLDCAVAEIMASAYSANQTTWQGDMLMKLLKQAEKIKTRNKPQSALTPLDPL